MHHFRCLDARRADDLAMRKFEEFRRRQWREALHLETGEAVGDQRVSFPLVLAPQIQDEAGEEDPERVERKLGDVDIACDGAGMHDETSILRIRKKG
jgi:hypothetical protein